MPLLLVILCLGLIGNITKSACLTSSPCFSKDQSIILFFPADVHKKELHQIHFQAWKKGLKSLYYCRSKSIQRAENISGGSLPVYSKNELDEEIDDDECLSCQ